MMQLLEWEPRLLQDRLTALHPLRNSIKPLGKGSKLHCVQSTHCSWRKRTEKIKISTLEEEAEILLDPDCERPPTARGSGTGAGGSAESLRSPHSA